MAPLLRQGADDGVDVRLHRPGTAEHPDAVVEPVHVPRRHERQRLPDRVLRQLTGERGGARVLVVADVGEPGVLRQLGQALDVGTAQTVGRVALHRPGVLQADGLVDLADEGGRGVRADRNLVGGDVAVGEGEVLAAHPGVGQGLLPCGDLGLEALAQRLGLVRGAGRPGDEVDVVQHPVDLTGAVGGGHLYHRGDLAQLLHGGRGEVRGGDDEVGGEGGDGVHARLAAGADVLGLVLQRNGAVPGLVPLDVRDAHRGDPEGDEALDDVPLGGDDLGGRPVELHLGALAVLERDRPGGLLLRLVGGGFAGAAGGEGERRGGGGGRGEQEASHEVVPSLSGVRMWWRPTGRVRSRPVRGSVSTSMRMP
jgi:hypothetical protein